MVGIKILEEVFSDILADGFFKEFQVFLIMVAAKGDF
jgi:hypothetical protein